jgi:multiple sugar transport system substrate-binding protein
MCLRFFGLPGGGRNASARKAITQGDGSMSKSKLTRRDFIKGVAAATATGPWILRHGGIAEAASEEARIISAAKKIKPVDLNGMIWSLYYRNMKRLEGEFRSKAGYGVGKIQDISVFQIPQRALAEAISRSGKFDFFHLDSNMIPSLASAGLLEPLDKYMDEAGFKLDMVGNFGSFMKYKGKTYGIPTDGNVHTHFMRKDLLEDPDEMKRFADKHGKPLAMPVTWEDNQQIAEFFHRPDKGLWGSGSLRNRANGVTWWYMYFHSAGGFPFDDDLNPTINNKYGMYAMDTYLNLKKASPPEAPGWGTPQMIPQHMNGHIASSQYWDGLISALEGPKSKTQKKWRYGLIPGSRFSGKLVHRSISSPLAAFMINRHSPRKHQAALFALYLATLKNSTEIVSHRTFTFHDPWHKGHFKSQAIIDAYTPEGMKSIKDSLLVTTPPIYLTGHREFQDVLAKNISEAYVGQRSAKDVLVNTEKAWSKLIRQIGKRKLKAELAGYKAAFPSMDTPS